MQRTGIPWADYVWNPIVGCQPISDACYHCWAATMANRLEAMGQKRYDGLTDSGSWNGKIRVVESEMDAPSRTKKRGRVFVCSMGDLFYDAVIDNDIAKVFAAMNQAPQHTYMLLTKRPSRMADFMREWYRDHPFMPNIWVGTTVECERYGTRIEKLSRIKASIRFISVEPMLGPLKLRYALREILNWVIVGCESGKNARSTQEEWVSDIWKQCWDNKVLFFLKQLKRNEKMVKMPTLFGRQWAEIPK